jgi:hypothetical protein
VCNISTGGSRVEKNVFFARRVHFFQKIFIAVVCWLCCVAVMERQRAARARKSRVIGPQKNSFLNECDDVLEQKPCMLVKYRDIHYG